MNKTKISWTDSTWNFITGCSRVSPGCERCYAERLDLRFRKDAKPWTAQNAPHNVRIHEEKLALPLKWKKPRKIFVNSMSDLFHDLVPDAILRQAFVTMAMCPQHTFQILTKRPARMKAFIESLIAEQDFFLDHWQGSGEYSTYFPNVWLGGSVEDQRRADERIPLLLQTPAAVRFLSCEPLLGPIDLGRATPCGYYCDESVGHVDHQFWTPGIRGGISWVICGGESGPNFRPMNLDWARKIRDECVAAAVPFWFKQVSALRSETDPFLDGLEWHEFPQ